MVTAVPYQGEEGACWGSLGGRELVEGSATSLNQKFWFIYRESVTVTGT